MHQIQRFRMMTWTNLSCVVALEIAQIRLHTVRLHLPNIGLCDFVQSIVKAIDNNMPAAVLCDEAPTHSTRSCDQCSTRPDVLPSVVGSVRKQCIESKRETILNTAHAQHAQTNSPVIRRHTSAPTASTWLSSATDSAQHIEFTVVFFRHQQ